MSQTKNRTQMKYEVRRDFAGASLTNAYQAWGTPLAAPARIVKVVNITNRTLDLSTDGTNDHDVFPASGGSVDDVTAARNMSEGAYFAKGTQFYIKAAAGAGTGTAYLVIQYTS